MNALRNVAVLAVLVVASGCATAGSHRAAAKLAPEMTKYKVAEFQLVNKAADAGDVFNTIRDQIAKEIESNDAEKTGEARLAVKLELVELGHAIPGARIFLGPLAGSDRVVVRGDVFDIKSNKVVGSFSGEGRFRGGGIIIGDTGFQRAAARLGEEVASYLNGNTEI